MDFRIDCYYWIMAIPHRWEVALCISIPVPDGIAFQRTGRSDLLNPDRIIAYKHIPFFWQEQGD